MIEYKRQEIKRYILKTIESMGVKVEKIILFGSRARKDFQTDSDWDLLMVLEKMVSREEKKEISHRIRRMFAEFYIPCDVIVKSEEEVENRKNVVGSVIKNAIEEGIPL